MTGSRGPKSKVDAVRRNVAHVIRIEGAPVDAPDLPDGYGPEAIAWWTACITGPVALAGLYTAMDWQIALRGALLTDLLYADKAQAKVIAGEIRQIEDKLGLSLSARQRLDIKIDPPGEEEKAPSRRERKDPRRG